LHLQDRHEAQQGLPKHVLSHPEPGLPYPHCGEEMKASDLTMAHIGEIVTVHAKQLTASGQLTAVTFRADLIWDQPLLSSNPTFTPGPPQVEISFGNSMIVVEPGATVELVE
jgi:hypothetical protein